MAMEEVRKRLTIETASAGLDGAAAGINKVADAEARLAVESQKSERAQLSMEGAFAKLERRYVDGIRQQQELEKVQRQVNAAVAQNPALQDRANAVLQGATARLNQVHAANENVAKSTGLARHEMINLGRQGADVFTQLASGQASWLIAAQQGPQILDVLATSQKGVVGTLKDGVGWLGRFAMSTAGVVTGVVGIGAAAIYAASQFARASTTIEQALEEQNRLLKEGKALLDQRTSAEARAQLQSREQTQFETLRNQLDLQNKLNAAMEEAARLAASKAGRPTGGGMPEMGIAPTGVGALSAPGYEKIIEAHEKLKAAQAAGLPGIKEFNAELAKVGLAHPELALIVQDMIKVGEEGLKLEFAAQRAKAMSDALAGIATNAQMAAVGLGSVAQFQVNNQKAKEAAEATERQAQATLRLAQAYPGITAETAKQLDLLNAQTAVANARSAAEKQIAEEKLRQVQLSQQNIPPEERALIIVKERAFAIAQANAQAQERLDQLRLEGKLISEISAVEKARIAAAAQYQKDIANNVDPLKAGQIAAQSIANARAMQDAADAAQSWSVRTDDARKAMLRYQEAARNSGEIIKEMSWELRVINGQLMAISGTWANFGKGGDNAFSVTGDVYGRGGSQFKSEGYKFTTETLPLQFAKNVYGAGGFDAKTFQPNATGIANMVDSYLAGQRTMATAGWAEGGGIIGAIEGLLTGQTMGGGVMFGGGGLSPDTLQIVQRLTELLPEDQKAGVIEREIAMFRAQPQNIEILTAIKQLTDSLEQLKGSTDGLKEVMTDVLSPFYSSDPRRTHLGFRAFAGGGIMTPYGELPIKHYAGGGITSSAQVAVFGEGSVPEAYVPVPSGRIPVTIQQPANSNDRTGGRPIFVSVSMTASVSREEARRTGFQIAQSMRRALG